MNKISYLRASIGGANTKRAGQISRNKAEREEKSRVEYGEDLVGNRREMRRQLYQNLTKNRTSSRSRK